MLAGIKKFLGQFRTVTKIDESCSVIRWGRDEYKYLEGGRALMFQAEMLSGYPQRVIYSRTIKQWLPPHENEIITDEKRKEILQRVCKYFDLNHISYTVG